MLDKEFARVILVFPDENHVFESVKSLCFLGRINFSCGGMIISALVEDGFLEKTINRSDGVSKKICLTEKGRKLYRLLKEIDALAENVATKQS